MNSFPKDIDFVRFIGTRESDVSSPNIAHVRRAVKLASGHDY
jgi:hypothetical protein